MEQKDSFVHISQMVLLTLQCKSVINKIFVKLFKNLIYSQSKLTIKKIIDVVKQNKAPPCPKTVRSEVLTSKCLSPTTSSKVPYHVFKNVAIKFFKLNTLKILH